MANRDIRTAGTEVQTSKGQKMLGVNANELIVIDPEKLIETTTAFSNLNDNLDEQGLVNVFDGQLKQGAYSSSSGSYVSTNRFSCNNNPISCSANDTITVKNKNCEYIEVLFYNNSSSLIYSEYTIVNNGKFTIKAPINATKFNINFSLKGDSSVETPPSHVSKSLVYINNAIDEINSKLSKQYNEIEEVYISSYTSSSEPYICPCDGYVRVVGWGDGSLRTVYANGTELFKCPSNSVMSCYVRNGMKIHSPSVDSTNVHFLKI